MGKWGKRVIHGAIAIVLVALGLAGFMKFSSGKPKVKRKRPLRLLPVVEVVRAQRAEHQVRVSAYGNVRPAETIRLVSEVAGKIIYASPYLVEGGRFEKDDLLVKIDPAHYEAAVALARAQVKEAESKVVSLEAEAQQAMEEWALNRKGDLNEPPPPLVVKEPQLMAAKGALEAAKAQLDRSLIDLQRTELRASFDGIVREEDVGIGQYVARGQILATLYGTELAEVVIPLETGDLKWIKIPGLTTAKVRGSKAVVRAGIGKEMSWVGRVARAGPQMDEKTRMIKIIVEVKGPYKRLPPLMPGLFVEVELMGPRLSTVKIPRSALVAGDKVWVVEMAGRLSPRHVKVARLEPKWALLEAGIEDGELVVVSPLKVMTKGMKVRTKMRDVRP